MSPSTTAVSPGKCSASIEADLAHCEIITLEQWKQRGLCERTKECYYGLYTNLF